MLPDGTRDILGIWIEQTEGAKCSMKVFTDLKTRGCHDILIAVTDGLEGMSDALGAVFPATTLQTCMVHLLPNSLAFANWKQRKPMTAALRPISAAASTDAASIALDTFEGGPWGFLFPTVTDVGSSLDMITTAASLSGARRPSPAHGDAGEGAVRRLAGRADTVKQSAGSVSRLISVGSRQSGRLSL